MTTMDVVFTAPTPHPFGYVPAYAYAPMPPCDHCLCIDVMGYQMGDRTRPHRRCCHCRKLYAVSPPEPPQEGE